MLYSWHLLSWFFYHFHFAWKTPINRLWKRSHLSTLLEENIIVTQPLHPSFHDMYSNKYSRPHQTLSQFTVIEFHLSYCHSHSMPRSTLWLNDLVNLNSNRVSWGSTPHSGRIGRVISTQLWLLHWSSRVLQSELNHSPHYGLQGQISVGGPQNQASHLPTEINWNSFEAPWCSPSTPGTHSHLHSSPQIH